MNDYTLAGDAGASAISTSPALEPAITIHVGRETYPVTADQLAESGFRQEFAELLASTTEPVVVTVADLPALADDARSRLLNLFKELGNRCRVRLGTDQNLFADPFDAMLSILVGPSHAVRYTNAKRAALQAAGLFHPDSLESACTRIQQRLKELGVKNVQVRTLIKEARVCAGLVEIEEDMTPQRAAEVLLAQLAVEGCTKPVRYFQHDFYRWQEGVWRRLDDAEFKARLVRTLQGDARFGFLTDKFVRDVLTNLKGMTYLACWHESMPFLVEAEEPLTLRRPRIVAFANGLVNLDEALSGKPLTLRPHDARWFSTNMLPYGFDPQAQCPLWMQTLGEILLSIGPDDHRVELLQEFMGWTLVPGDLSFQKFLTLVGKGSNGKSTILAVWEAMLGHANVSHVPLDRLSDKFCLFDMKNKLANLAGDMNYISQVAEGVLKQLTAGDAVQAERKYQQGQTMTPTAKMIFATNSLPPINDRTDGVWRRMIAMPFQVQITGTQIDPRRVEKLLAELPGIFNWALAGAVRLHQQQTFTGCQVCLATVNDHRIDCDPFKQFVDENCLLDPNAAVRKEDLYASYVQFCISNGRKPKASSEFGKWVAELKGVTSIRETKGPRKMVYKGIGLLLVGCLPGQPVLKAYHPYSPADHRVASA